MSLNLHRKKKLNSKDHLKTQKEKNKNFCKGTDCNKHLKSNGNFIPNISIQYCFLQEIYFPFPLIKY